MDGAKHRGAEALRGRAKRQGGLLIGVVHLPPLPGSPRHGGRGLGAIIEHARRDAEALGDAGFDGYVVENFGDAPFFAGPAPPWVLTVMTRITLELPRDGLLVGANVLRNDAAGALAIAKACDLAFVRVNVHVGAAVTDQGLIEGRAAETLRQRALLGTGAAILADVAVKHARPLGAGPPDLADAARETAYRGLADGLIVTGRATGSPADRADLEVVRAAVPDRTLFVGSGATEATVAGLLELSDGVIVGTATKDGGRVERPVDPERARAFVRAARGN